MVMTVCGGTLCKDVQLLLPSHDVARMLYYDYFRLFP